MSSEKWFGRTYQTFGDTNHDFLIKTRGLLKVLSGKQFIDVVKDGKLNVDSTLLLKVSSPNDINSDGIYYCTEDSSVYIKIDSNLIKVYDSQDSTYVSYITQQKVTPEQLQQAQNNIGLVFKTLLDALDLVIDGVIYIIDELTFYTVTNGNFTKLLLDIPDPYLKQLNINKLDNGSKGSINIIGEGKNKGISFSKSDIYELGGLLFISSDKILLMDSKVTVSLDKLFSDLDISTSKSIISNNIESIDYLEGSSGFKLYSTLNNGSILEVDKVIERNKDTLSKFREYSIGTTITSITQSEDEDLIFNITTYPHILFNKGDYLEVHINNNIPIYFYVDSVLDKDISIKFYPDYSVIIVNNSEEEGKKYFYKFGESEEVEIELEEDQDFIDVFNGASLYKIAQLGNKEDSSTWLTTMCTDYINNSISILNNYTAINEEGKLEVFINKKALISELSSFQGLTFEAPDYPKYSEELNNNLIEDYNEEDFDDVIPTIKWIKNQSMGLPIGSIIMWYGANVPNGWLSCNGLTFDASIYPKLYEVLGSNTLPDFSNKLPVGIGSDVGNTGSLTGVSFIPDLTPLQYLALNFIIKAN